MHLRPWLFLLLCCPGFAPAASKSEGSDAAYREAAKAYYALKSDAARRRFRHSWQHVAKKFESVAAKYPKSDRSPEALFTAAQLFSDLSRISLLDEDTAASAENYARLISAHPKHRLADDAALALAHIHLERQGNPELAKKVLARALRDSPGDRAGDIRSLLGRVDKTDVAKTRDAVAAAPSKDDLKDGAPDEARDSEEAADAEASDRALSRLPSRSTSAKEARARLKGLSPSKKSELTLAEQLGLKFRRVVIDPGHGGHDSGAVGRNGVREKDVALDVSKRVAEHLREAGLKVVLTRDDDTFVRLEDRARIANRARGDLFLSIHCNSAKSRKLRGVETYTLNTASDRYSIRLAARENSSTERGMSDLRFILADLATKANTAESQRLAVNVQKNLVGNLSSRYGDIRDLGTKEALFYVLLGAQMPAVLVETSFVSHPDEERRLKTQVYRRDLARSISEGVKDFLGRNDRWARADEP